MDKDLILRLGMDTGKARASLNQFVAGAKSGMAEAGKAVDSHQAGWDSMEGLIGKAREAITSYAGQMTAMGVAKDVFAAFTDEIERGRLSLFKATDLVKEYRAALLELSALKGNLGAGGTTATLAEDIAFRAKTLQSREESRAFTEAALGVGQSAIGRLITQPEFQRALELGGAFQAAEGGAAATHGQLIGQIPALVGRQITGEEAFAKEQLLYKIIQPGGSSFSQFIGQYLKNAPLVTTGLFGPQEKGVAEMAALQSFFSVNAPESAGTNVEQLVRGTVGAMGRMRGAKMMEGVETQKTGEYLKGIGATDQDSPIAIARKISDDITRQSQAAGMKGEQLNVMSYLRTKGYANQEDIMALMAFHGGRATYEEAFAPLVGQEPTAAEARKTIEEAQRTDPALIAKGVAVSAEAAKIKQGAGGPEMLELIRSQAFARRKARGEETYDTYEEMRKGGFFSEGGFLGEMIFGHQKGTQIEAQRMLAEEARRVGIPESELPAMSYKGQMGETVPVQISDEQLLEMARKVQRAGGSIVPGLEGIAAGAAGALTSEELGGARPAGAGGEGGPVMADPKLIAVMERVEENTRPREQPQPAVPPRLPSRPADRGGGWRPGSMPTGP